MEQIPRAILVGAESGRACGPEVRCVSTVDDAGPYIGVPGVVLVVADTAREGGALGRFEALKAHSAAGGRSIVLRATHIEEALTWDIPGSREIVLPVDASVLADALALDRCNVPTAPVTADIAPNLWRSYEDPFIGYKRGMLWLAPQSGQLMVSGAFSGMPVPLDCEAECEDGAPPHPRGLTSALPCCIGFSAYMWPEGAAAAWFGATILRVALSGWMHLDGSPRAEHLGYRAAHQQVLGVTLFGRCYDCGGPTNLVSARARPGRPVMLVERCEAHRRDHVLEHSELQERLGSIKLTIDSGIR